MTDEARGCVWFLFGRRRRSAGRADGGAFPKVQINKFFVSNAEGDLIRVLRHVIGNRGHILAQVSLRQLLWMPGNNQSNPGRSSWQNKIAARAVDFVVCDPATRTPATLTGRLVFETGADVGAR